MARSINPQVGINSVQPGAEAGTRAPIIGSDEYVPPVLTREQAGAVHALKLFLKAVADVNRLAILQELARENGLSVLDLSDRLVLSQPLTSWHLHILKRARLVAPTHQGRQRIYRLNKERLQEYKDLFQWVTDLYKENI
ncbi:MAG TPA: metalloregulator ArsR/SmtB family transcription factor [Chloroflexia bacterium]|nr:metalloregulator ArsR/SmtB family transcription factor [Chloroflexia bacterium]